MFARDSHDRRPEDLAGRRWAGYIRESTRGQADRYGPAIQRAEHIRYADRYGLTGSGLEYVDLVSGKETLRRTDFRRMLADAERGAFDVLLCYDTSRFARNVADAFTYRDQLERAGVVVVFCADGLIAGNTETFELEGLKAVSDAGYIRRLSRNVGRGYGAKWERFGDPGGRPPLGFARTGPHRLLEPVEGPELAKARAAFALYALGVHSDLSISIELGLTEFHVEELLQNPLYAGRAVRHKGRVDQEERPTRFPAPVDPFLFERVQELRAQRRTRHPAGAGGFTRRNYPLVRLLRCARCGTHYRADANGGIRRVRHVARPACDTSLTHRADQVEEQVASLLDRIRLSESDIDAVVQVVRDQPDGDRHEANDLARDAQRHQLQQDLAARRISLAAFTRAWAAIDRPAPITRRLGRETFEDARRLLADFGGLWRDEAVPGALKEEAARQIFDRIDLAGSRVAAVYPREEHAWLLGMAARRTEGVVLVGAKGFEPSTS